HVYAAAVHSLTPGFAMPVTMPHAPIILPAVLRRRLPCRSAMWAPLGLLHLGLAVRVFAGDLPARPLPWQLGGTLNVAAVLLFLVIAVTSSVLGTRTRPESERPPGHAPSERSAN